MRALHRSELRKLSPEDLAKMAADILAILAEIDCLKMIQEEQAERRAAMMGIEVEEQPSLPTVLASRGVANASARP